MKIGLDTNILIRFITNDDPGQADQVENLFLSFKDQEITFVINAVILAELGWVKTHV